MGRTFAHAKVVVASRFVGRWVESMDTLVIKGTRGRFPTTLNEMYSCKYYIELNYCTPCSQRFSESKASDIVGDRVLGARLHPGLTISENSSEVFATRFSPDGK